MLPRRNDTGHDDEAIGVWNVRLLRNARGNGGSIGEFDAESSSSEYFRRRYADYSKDTCSNSDAVRQN